MTTVATVLKQTGTKFGEQLLPSPLRRRDAWVAYFAVLIPALTYLLCVSHHSEEVLYSIQSFPTRTALMKCFNRNTALAVVYGPQRYRGLGFRNLVVEQGIAQLQMIMRHVRAQTEQGKLFLITLRWWQLQAGMDFPLLEDPWQKLPHLQWNWFTALCSFLRNIKGSLHFPSVNEFLPLPLRQGDQCIMDFALQLPKIRPAELKAFNRYRLHLGVMFLSEIRSLVGDQIARDAWTGFRPRQSRYLWPFQPKPGPISFRIWRRVLKQILKTIPHHTSAATRSLQLAPPLGCWHTTSKWFRDQQEAFYSTQTTSLYMHDGIRQRNMATAGGYETQGVLFAHKFRFSHDTSVELRNKIREELRDTIS